MRSNHHSNHHSPEARFPLWPFLTQPVFSSKLILNPFKFWQHYNIQLLEQCWKHDPIQLLERCWQKEPKSNNFHL